MVVFRRRGNVNGLFLNDPQGEKKNRRGDIFSKIIASVIARPLGEIPKFVTNYNLPATIRLQWVCRDHSKFECGKSGPGKVKGCHELQICRRQSDYILVFPDLVN